MCLQVLPSYFIFVAVETLSAEECLVKEELNLTSSHGFIASIVTSETQFCGSPSHPWQIVGQPGQRINITLLDFSLPSNLLVRYFQSVSRVTGSLETTTEHANEAEEPDSGSDKEAEDPLEGAPGRPPCDRRYAVVTNQHRIESHEICGSNRRVIGGVLTSTDNILRISITSSTTRRDPHFFVFEYSGKLPQFYSVTYGSAYNPQPRTLLLCLTLNPTLVNCLSPLPKLTCKNSFSHPELSLYGTPNPNNCFRTLNAQFESLISNHDLTIFLSHPSFNHANHHHQLPHVA